MKYRLSNEKGFTLIETAIAMLVMLVVGLGASSLFLYSLRYNSGGTDRALALAVAQQRLEGLRGKDFNDAELTPCTTTSIHAVNASASTYNFTSTPVTQCATDTTRPTAPQGSRFFRVETQVVGLPVGAATPKRKQITLTVTADNADATASWTKTPFVITVSRSSSVSGAYKL